MKNIGPSKFLLASCLGFILGIGLADFLIYDRLIYIISVILLIIITILFWNEKKVSVFAFGAIFIILGLAYFHWYKTHFLQIGLDQWWGKNVEFVGQVYAEPEKKGSETKYTIRVHNMQKPKKIDKSFTDFVLVTTDPYPEFNFTDFVQVNGKIQEPKIYPDFNYKAYLLRFGTSSVIYKPKIKLVNDNTFAKKQGMLENFWISIKKSLYIIKTKFTNSINQILPEPYASFLAGILVGAKRSIPENLMDVFNRTGTTHIVVISGYNLTIIAAAVFFLMSGFPRYLMYVSAAFLIILFTILTGGAPPVLRATLMALIVLWAQIAGRKSDAAIALILAGVVMILLNPQVLRFDLGFQLSFLATIGILYFIEPFEWLIKKLKIKIPKMIGETLFATLSAQLLVVPLIMYNFGQLSIIAPIANILVLPFIPTIMLYGFVIGILAMIALPLGKILGWFLYLPLLYIIWILENLAKIPGATLDVSKFSWIWLLGYYILIGIIWFWWRRKKEIKSKDVRN